MAQPLLDAGSLPNLRRLVESGVSGKLASLTPRLSPSLWTGIATGRRADAHGVLGYVVPAPGGEGVRPVGSVDLATPPVWQIVQDAGRRAATVGWPVTHPATAFDGIVVSDAFPEAPGGDPEDWPLPASSVSPPALRDVLSDLRVHPAEIAAEQILPFVPAARRIDQETDDRLNLLRWTLARSASIHGAATWIAEHERWDLLAIHYDLIGILSTAFMQHRAPRMAHVTETDFAIYRDVVDGAYRFADLMLGRLLELAGPETALLLVSDHGFQTDHLRPAGNNPLAAGRAAPWFRGLGILAAAGPGIRRDELVFGAVLPDVAPTVLALLGLPAPGAVDGRLLQGMLESPLRPAPAGDSAVTEFRARVSDEPDDSATSPRIATWIGLGLIAPLPADPAEAAEAATVQRLANLAQVRMEKRDHAGALAALDELLALAPEDAGARLGVAHCHLALGRPELCREALADLHASGHRYPEMDLLHGRLCALEGDEAGARRHLEQAESTGAAGGARGPWLLERIGRVHLEGRRWADAERAFQCALEADPDFAFAHDGLGIALGAQGRHDEAIERFMWSLGLLYQQPAVHFRLGVALAAAGQLGRAREALGNALGISPDFPSARKALGRVEGALARRMRASAHADPAGAPTSRPKA